MHSRPKTSPAAAEKRLKTLYNASLVIIDEVGQPISRQEAHQLFELVNRLYQQTSVIITSNKSFEEWGGIPW